MKRNTIVMLALSLLLLMLLTGCCLSHKWEEATCTEPKTCTKCGKTEGEALGHTWTDATCTEDSVCTVCGEKGSGALGHTIGDWEVQTEATKTSAGEQVKKCTLCGEVLETKTYRLEPESITLLTDDGFSLSEEDYYRHLEQWLYADSEDADFYEIDDSGIIHISDLPRVGIGWNEGDEPYQDHISFVGPWDSIKDILIPIVHSIDPAVTEDEDTITKMTDVTKAWAWALVMEDGEMSSIALPTGMLIMYKDAGLSGSFLAMFCTLQYYLENFSS